jgi:hypothetical protein
VFENNGRKLHTTRSWGFMGLEDNNGVISSNSIWNKARFGDGVVIANLDTGPLSLFYFIFLFLIFLFLKIPPITSWQCNN